MGIEVLFALFLAVFSAATVFSALWFSNSGSKD